MPVALLDLQRAFRQALASGEATAMAPWIDPAGLSADRRVAIYRNNVQTALREALRADYPVIERLVGRDFFDHMAGAFISVTPSTSGDVGNYGSEFPRFLEGFAAAATLPYLADVARLEQAWLRVFLAAEAAPGDFSGLGKMPPERLSRLRFSFHPAVRLLTSHYPVLTIWRVNQPDHSGDAFVDLGRGGESALLQRAGIKVESCLLAPAEYAWLSTLAAGGRLDEAVAAAFALAPDFDLAACLQRHVQAGALISYSEEIAS